MAIERIVTTIVCLMALCICASVVEFFDNRAWAWSMIAVVVMVWVILPVRDYMRRYMQERWFWSLLIVVLLAIMDLTL